MRLGGFNGSEDSEDEILFTRGRRPQRRRPTCSLNLRDVISNSSSSSEEIEPSDTPPSLLRPTLTSFNFTHNTAFHSRRPNDTLSSLSSDIPGTNGDSSLVPSAANTRSNSWLSSQEASGRIRQVGDKPNKGQSQPPRDKAKPEPPGTSPTSHRRAASAISSTATAQSTRKHSSRSKESAEPEDRKAKLENFRKKLEETEREPHVWETNTDWHKEPPPAADESTKPSVTLPTQSSKQTKPNPPLGPQRTKTLEPQPQKTLESKPQKTLEPPQPKTLESKPQKTLEPPPPKTLEPPPPKTLESKPQKTLEPPPPKTLEPPLPKTLESKPQKTLDLPPPKTLEPSPPKTLEPAPHKTLEPRPLMTLETQPHIEMKSPTPPLNTSVLIERGNHLSIPKGSHKPVERPVLLWRSQGSEPSLSIKRSASQTSSHPSFKLPETFPPPPRPPPASPNKTLQRCLTALANICAWAVQKLTEGHGKLPSDFVDGVDISSDEAKDNWSVEDVEVQLDSEWLELSRTSIPKVDDTISLVSQERRKARLPRIPVLHFPLKYLKVTLPVYKALLVLGRFPFEVDKSEDIPRLKYKKKSWRHFLFVGTSVVSFFTAILMIANFMRISTAVSPLTLHETATRLERDKYWIEATLEIVNLLFLAISSVSMLEYGGGTSVVDFFNRWSTALYDIRYNVTSGLNNICTAFFWCYGIYAGTFVALFFAGGDGIPTVRGSCGFTGLLILNSFTERLRLQPAYRVVEFLGLFVHLYTTLAGSLVTLVICMHCWASDNAAKRFNNRLGRCLRSVIFSHPATASQAYPKLFSEHLVVTSFPRQIGKVFRLTFIAYLTSKMVELVFTLFGAVEPIVNGFPKSDQKFFNVHAQSEFDPKEIVPILEVEPSHIQALKCGLYVAKTWIPWLIFMEIVQRPGKSLIKGAGLVVRNLLRHSKSSHALRFITSMEFSFSSRIAFNVNPGVQLTREFSGKFVAFALAIVVTLLQFVPSAVNPQDVVICDKFGGCSLFHFPSKSRSRDAFRDSIGKVISQKHHATTLPPHLPAPHLQLPGGFFRFYSVPPCFSDGRLPRVPPTYAFECQEESSVYIPTYFRRTIGGKYFKLPPIPDHSCVQSSNIPIGEALFDCFGDEVSPLEVDECGNPKLPTPDETGAKKLPILRAVRLNREIFCCFVYSGLENQAERCNLLSTATHSCSRRSKTPGRKIHEESIVQMWSKSSEALVESQLPLWTGCICQGLQGLPVSSTSCSIPPTPATQINSNKPTTSKMTTPATKESTTTPKSPPGIQCPFANNASAGGACTTCSNGNPTAFFQKHFLASCVLQNGQVFAVPSVANLESGVLESVLSYPCFPQTELTPRPQDAASKSKKFYDCFGGEKKKVYSNQNVDDCGTHRVNFTNPSNGTQTEPTIKVVPLPGNSSRFLCCWDYSEWQEPGVNSTCNTYPGSDLSKVCYIRTQSSMQTDEVVCKGNVKGNQLYWVHCRQHKKKKCDNK